jgi:hypothetical protein
MGRPRARRAVIPRDLRLGCGRSARSFRAHKGGTVIPISCDRCGFVSDCRFEYIDPDQDNMPMLFCSIDCLTHYVKQAKRASTPNLQEKGGSAGELAPVRTGPALSGGGVGFSNLGKADR